MTQISFIRTESDKKGAKRTIKLAAIPAASFVQYTKDHAKLRGVIGEYGYFNQVTILNSGAINIEISLDFAEDKTYPVPASSSISIDEVMFQGFNVVNLDAVNPTIINMITVTPSFESPLLREKIKTKKMMLGGDF